MYKSSGLEEIVELGDIPSMDSGAPQPKIIASEQNLILTYTQSQGGSVVTVKFDSPLLHIFGAPNDETLHGHPLYGGGIHYYSINEVTNSGWIDDIKKAQSIHPRYDSDRFSAYRHFIFAFHDSTFECVAKGFSVAVG